MKILVLRGGALGDFVITLPALRLLRERWPDATIELVGNARAARLGACSGFLNTVHSQEEQRWSRLGADDPDALSHSEPLARWIEGFDLVVNFWSDPDGAIARDLGRLGFGTSGPRIAINHPARPTHAPAAAHFCKALRPLGASTDVFSVRIQTPKHLLDSTAEALPALNGNCIAWHPGSGSPRKNWPLQRWLDVIRHPAAASPDRRLVVLLGETEQSLATDPAFLASLPPASLVRVNDPPEVLAALLARCSLFLGHDTGPAHVAAAVGCACVLVFGPTDPEMWAPPGPHVKALRRGELTENVEVHEVVAAIRDLVAVNASEQP